MSDKSSETKYTYEQTKEWAERESGDMDDGITFLYIFGAFAFLIIFAGVLLLFVGGTSSEVPLSSVHIETLGSETDATSTEVQTEYDLIADTKKGKNLLKEAKS